MSQTPNWKPLPRAVDKRAKRRTAAAADQRARKAVREHWRYRCRVCGRRTSVVHEQKRRGAGGLVSLQNSYLACSVDDGGVCHDLLQLYRIVAVMASDRDAPFDASEDLVFEMPEAIAELVFENRPRPAHVRIVQD